MTFSVLSKYLQIHCLSGFLPNLTNTFFCSSLFNFPGKYLLFPCAHICLADEANTSIIYMKLLWELADATFIFQHFGKHSSILLTILLPSFIWPLLETMVVASRFFILHINIFWTVAEAKTGKAANLFLCFDGGHDPLISPKAIFGCRYLGKAGTNAKLCQVCWPQKMKWTGSNVRLENVDAIIKWLLVGTRNTTKQSLITRPFMRL